MEAVTQVHTHPNKQLHKMHSYMKLSRDNLWFNSQVFTDDDSGEMGQRVWNCAYLCRPVSFPNLDTLIDAQLVKNSGTVVRIGRLHTQGDICWILEYVLIFAAVIYIK
jgi:hypothetical protein